MSSIEATTTTEHPCAHCGRHCATQACSGCKNAPTVDGSSNECVYYCSAKCQKANWVEHKEKCLPSQARKSLFRAGSLLQKIFIIYQKESYYMPLVKVEEKDGQLLVHEGWREESPTVHPGGHVFDVPDSLFKNDNDKNAALSLLFCTDSLANLHKLAGWLLKGSLGVCTKINEIKISVKNVHRQALFVNPLGEVDEDNYNHEFFKITLKNGETWAVDLAGAQFGWYEAVVPYESFMKRHCQRVEAVKPSGNAAAAMLTRLGAFETAEQYATPKHARQIAEEFTMGVETYTKKHYPKANTFLKLPNKAYDTAQQEFLDEAKKQIKRAVAKTDPTWAATVKDTKEAMAKQTPKGTPKCNLGIKSEIEVLMDWLSDDTPPEVGHLPDGTLVVTI